MVFLKGMMNTLDPHSAYLDPDLYQRIQEDTKGEFAGLGIEVTQKDGIIVISLGPGHNKTDMGGKNAPLKPEDSVKNMAKLIKSLQKKQSGRFFFHDGSELEW